MVRARTGFEGQLAVLQIILLKLTTFNTESRTVSPLSKVSPPKRPRSFPDSPPPGFLRTMAQARGKPEGWMPAPSAQHGRG